MKRERVIHPFFFSLFPALALYAHNIRTLPIPLSELAGPLAFSLAGSGLLFLLLRAAIKDASKSGLLVSLLLLWFFSFGHVAGPVAVWTGGLFDRSFFFATAILVGLVAFLIVRSRRSCQGLSRSLNVVSVLLVLFNLASAGHTLSRRPRIVVDKGVHLARQATARPNIYYIVLDAYTRADILQEVFSFDNTAFLAELEAKGFFVASKSYANYGFTYHSLASSLNLTYLDALATEVGRGAANQEPLYRMIQGNRVMEFLKGQGYTITCFSSEIASWDEKTVDHQLGSEGATSEFLSAFLNTTPVPLFFNGGANSSSYKSHRRHILDAFRILEESPLREGPFFIFAHLMAPHPPFVFGPNGEAVEPDYLFSKVDADRLHGARAPAIRDYIVRYRDQLAFLNKKILGAVEAILRLSPEPPIIILQGDHGSRAYADLDRPEACYLKENLAVLNSYRLPGDGRTLLYPEISPVNTFRLVFKHYFGADLDLLEDRSAWCAWWRPFVFIPFDEAAYAATPESIMKQLKPKPPIVQRRPSGHGLSGAAAR
jgi:hypothetical protein